MIKTDIAKRVQIMRRSQKLGHCICDPRRGCPCEIFIRQNICPCAGERPHPAQKSKIKLTEFVRNPGCASKIPAVTLERFLSRLPKTNDPAVISGLSAADDAGVYQINRQTTIVQTVDIFTPCVDDPFTFGKICAANCLSDIYAMGGKPRTALSILAFPSDSYDGDIMFLMLKGAMNVLKTAGCTLLGGHSIKDDEIKLGFAITGTIRAGREVALETAKVGDMLVLTKPLGVGILNFAGQIGRGHQKGLHAAEKSMMRLNKEAADAMVKVGVSACTDITGFGLFGHLIRMMRHSGMTAHIDAEALPAFPGVFDLLRAGIVPGAVERNAEFVGKDLIVDKNMGDEYKNLGLGAETSGGLLISVPRKRHPHLIKELNARGLTPATIGKIIKKSRGRIILSLSFLRKRESIGMPVFTGMTLKRKQ